MLEQMKQALERAERKLSAYVGVCAGDKELTDAVLPMVRQAIKELESQEPVAWMHIMDNTEGIKANGAGIVSITQKRKHPFGKAGIDFSKSYPVTSTPLYTHPPQRKCENCGEFGKCCIETEKQVYGVRGGLAHDAQNKEKNT